MSLYTVERSLDANHLNPARMTMVTRGTLADCLAYLKTVPKKHRASHVVLDPDGKQVSGVNPQ